MQSACCAPGSSLRLLSPPPDLEYSLDLIVKKVKLSHHLIETPDQSIYRRYSCPICNSEEYLQSVGEVHANGKTSLESAYCTRCEHRFHRKFPAVEWLQEYYSDKFESSRGTVPNVESVPIVSPGIYRRLRSRLGALIRYGISHAQPNRIHDFCLGVTKSDGGYYRINPGIKRILEVGCGNGLNLKFFTDLGFETYGTESNPVRVAECRSRGLRVFPSNIDGFRTVEHFAPFDFIYSSHVLEHVIDIDSHIRQVAAMLRPEGFVYIETPDLSGESLVYQTHTVFHVHTFSLASMLRLLRKHGFEAVRVLVDGNIQVLAQKISSTSISTEPLKGTIFANTSMRYLNCIAAHGGGEYMISWDHFRLRIMRVSDGVVLYDAGLSPLTIGPGPNQHEMLVEAGSNDVNDRILPVRFIHGELPNPPIWYKD